MVNADISAWHTVALMSCKEYDYTKVTGAAERSAKIYIEVTAKASLPNSVRLHDSKFT